MVFNIFRVYYFSIVTAIVNRCHYGTYNANYFQEKVDKHNFMGYCTIRTGCADSVNDNVYMKYKDIFYIPSSKGVIYGLFSTSEPNQIRYVGQTKYEPIVRLRAHLSEKIKNVGLRNWIFNVRSSGHQLGLRILRKCPLENLNFEEKRFIQIYRKKGEIFNNPISNKPIIGHRRIQPHLVSTQL